MSTQDQVITCADCGGQFHWSADEQAYYTAHGYVPPTRCKPCRQAKKARRDDIEQKGGKK